MNKLNHVIKTGFSAIDVVTGGMKPSEVMVIAGQGRTGKTSLGATINGTFGHKNVVCKK